MRIYTMATASLLLSALLTTAVFAERSPVAGNPLTGKLNFVSTDFPSPPVGKVLKTKPAKISVYEYDSKPLGDRSPFLLVHGLRGEYYPVFRWEKLIHRFTSEDQFASQYKVYMLRYDSTEHLDITVPQFRDAIASLYNSAQQRPITIMALSMGGNLVYEGLLDKPADSKVKLVFTLGTPFRGSPLFCADWVRYSMFKNPCFPWTRVDHSFAYDMYFSKNRNLQEDLRWDDVDKTIPEIGMFKSHLPLGPKGDLTVADTINNRLLALETKPFDKKKLITYGGYLVNSYMLPERRRIVETTVMAPYTLMFMKVPAHLAREHPVLKLLNSQISATIPSQDSTERMHTKFVYQLNDGITPVTSALFLPSQVCETVSRESDLAKVTGAVDVKLARVFRNIDHLTYIDGYRPIRASAQIKDELNPDQAARPIFDWMLNDLFNAINEQNKLAKETSTPNVVPVRAD